MRKQSKLTLATAGLALSGMAWLNVGLPGYVQAQDRAVTAAGATSASQAQTTQARQAIASATNAALDKDWSTLVSNLSDSDRQRVQQQWSGVNTSDLDRRIDRIRQAWQQKYGQEFRISDADTALTGFYPAPAGGTAMTGADATMAAGATGRVSDNRGNIDPSYKGTTASGERRVGVAESETGPGSPTNTGTAFNPAAGNATNTDSARTAGGTVTTGNPTAGLTSDPNRSKDTSRAAGFKESDPTNPDSPMVREGTTANPQQARTDDSTPHNTNTQASNRTVYGTPGNDANRAGAAASATETNRSTTVTDTSASAHTSAGHASAGASAGSVKPADQSPAVTGTLGTRDTIGQRGLPGGDRAYDPNTSSDRMTTLGDRTGNAQDRNQNTAAVPGSMGTHDTAGQRGNPDSNRAFDPAANARRDAGTGAAGGSVSVGGTGAGATASGSVNRNANEAVDGSRTNVATGSHADQQGTADRIGGRDIPAPNVDVTGAAARDNAAAARDQRQQMAGDAAMTARTDTARTAGYGDTATSGQRDRLILLAPAGADAQQTPQQVTLVRDGAASGYKLDIPDNVDAQRLQANLARHLDQVTGMQAQWPDDVNAAYREVSRHVLAALYDSGTSSTQR